MQFRTLLYLRNYFSVLLNYHLSLVSYLKDSSHPVHYEGHFHSGHQMPIGILMKMTRSLIDQID
ncbi:hypothetical protein ACFSKI_07210 [Pseudogracilibacillus auburnensis]|uniref:Uncharacterized protein n=1 Tax=Pseudogracilibacillus auburnensis TaxID=1494959 RepID=A0A2V3VP05_9BACI|nr:hypothetical protein DFR56_11514 [Pseudogracilibacillus auburnensis]